MTKKIQVLKYLMSGRDTDKYLPGVSNSQRIAKAVNLDDTKRFLLSMIEDQVIEKCPGTSCYEITEKGKRVLSMI